MTDVVPTIEALAQHLSKSPRQTSYYLSAGMREVCKVAGGYSTSAADKWVAENTKGNSEDAALRREHLAARIANLREDLRQKKQARRIKAGEMLDTYLAQQWVRAAFLRVRQQIETLPEALSKEFGGEQRTVAADVGKRLVHRILKELAANQFNPEELKANP